MARKGSQRGGGEYQLHFSRPVTSERYNVSLDEKETIGQYLYDELKKTGTVLSDDQTLLIIVSGKVSIHVINQYIHDLLRGLTLLHFIVKNK